MFSKSAINSEYMKYYCCDVHETIADRFDVTGLVKLKEYMGKHCDILYVNILIADGLVSADGKANTDTESSVLPWSMLSKIDWHPIFSPLRLKKEWWNIKKTRHEWYNICTVT